MSNTMSETVRPIDATIRQSLQEGGYGSYFSYAGSVIAALHRREMALSTMLIDYAVDAGADETEVRSYLREIGMAVADAQPSEDDESAEPEDILTRIDARLNGLVEKVEGLAQFARNNGWRG